MYVAGHLHLKKGLHECVVRVFSNFYIQLVHSWYIMVQKRDNLEMKVLAYLFNSEAHIRGMERAIGVPHSTLLRVLSRMENKNIIDYKTVGKNKQYFIKESLKSRKMLENMENYKLLTLFEKYPKLEILFEDVMKKCDSRLIILFGSYAKNIPRKESDIDLYIETEDVDVKRKAEEINSKLSVKIGKFDRHSLLIKEIIRNHIILKGVEHFYEQIFD